MKKHYPWIIVASALFALFVSNGVIIGGLSVFDEELLFSRPSAVGSLVKVDDDAIRG